ncbi:MAG TPA: DnaJ domain-containing protein [Melioribacteraceae bacterium]|nr:DnaJ domain-containing protein [Melioribacteraceae bacterium]
MTRDEAINILKLQTKNPTQEEIIAAYRKLSRKYHPDLYQSSDEAVKEVMHEKFIQITQAKDFLLNNQQSSSYSSSNYSQSTSGNFSAEVSQFEAYLQRRQFYEAENIINSLIAKYGETSYLLELRIKLASESGNYNLAYSDIKKLESIEPSLANDADFQHYKAIMAAQAGDYYIAMASIDKAISLLGSPAPEYLATKAHILIMQGRTSEADQIISILERYDPNHPLVQQRRQVYNVGGRYVDKGNAATSACAACAILECLFDCC